MEMDTCQPACLFTRRRLLVGASAVCTSLLLPRTGFGESDTSLAELHLEVAQKARSLGKLSSGEISILIPNGGGENLAPVVAAFSELTSIKVAITETAVDDVNTQLLLDGMSAGVTYDLALPATFGIPDLVANNVVIPLSDYAQRHEPAGFREDVLYSLGDTFDGDIYGFQANGDACVMFYNNLLVSESLRGDYESRYGAALEIPVTWQELDRQIEFFHKPDEGRYGGLLFRTAGYLVWEWWVRFHAKGVWPLSASLEPQIHSDAGISALEEMIAVTRFLVPEVSQLNLFENRERYSEGDVYANIGWGGTQKYLNKPESPLRGNLSFGQTPGGIVARAPVSIPYFNRGWNYVVTANSNLPELAYLFALFASTPAMSTLAVRQQGGLFDPFRAEHYEDPAVIDTYSKEFLEVHRASLDSAIPDLYLANQSQYFGSLGTWLGRAIDGAVTPEQALLRVSQQWELINDRTDIEVQKWRWNNLRQKYPVKLQMSLSDL